MYGLGRLALIALRNRKAMLRDVTAVRIMIPPFFRQIETTAWSTQSLD
jgi:hypothetical protein